MLINIIILNLLFCALYNALKDNNGFIGKPLLKKFCEFLEKACKIPKPYYLSNNVVTMRNLFGDEKLRLFSQIESEDFKKHHF